MREQDFGADPLEAFGGFRNLQFDDTQYPSELAQGGTAHWQTTEMNSEGWIHVLYPDIEWRFNQQSLGWGFNQFQAWARSSFVVPSMVHDHRQGQCSEGSNDNQLCSVTIQCENVGDFFLDDERLSGDWYGYGLTRHTLRLRPGSRHTLSVRIVHEVRIFGGIIVPPPSKFRCELRLLPPSGNDDLVMVQVVKEGTGGVIVMDAVDNNLAGEYISIALRNVGPEKVLVKSVRVKRGSEQYAASLSSLKPISLYPSTHRPIAIRLERLGLQLQQLNLSLEFELSTVPPDLNRAIHRLWTGTLETDIISIEQHGWGEGAYKYTFLDFDGTVQYAAAIPPSDPSSQPTNSAPTVIALHGAGVEVAQAPFWLSEYRQRERSWIVLPTGRSSWGYDWHGASIKNVMNAIQSLTSRLPGVPESLKGLPGIRPDPERLLMAGHSNGGQGAWYLVTHFPDMAIAATPAAGYVNIRHYVPFSGWLSNSYTDSHLRGLLESSIIEFDNDVHMSNTVGVPILARTGSLDDNVPPLNTRKMVRLGQENAHNLSSVRLSEVQGEGHWFVGALHDGVMQEFLQQHLHDTVSGRVRGQIKPQAVSHPPFPNEFEITVINPAGMGSKGSIQVEQLHIPYRKGTIKVKIQDHVSHLLCNGIQESATTWVLQTKNIRRFRLVDSASLRNRRGTISRFIVDGVVFNPDGEHRDVSEELLFSGTFLQDPKATKNGPRWQFIASNDWMATERHRETYGPAIQILEKEVVVVIGTGGNEELNAAADRIGKLVAHDIYLYGRHDVEVMTDEEYHDRIMVLEQQDGAEAEARTNLVLIGNTRMKTFTHHDFAGTEPEVGINGIDGSIFIQPRSDLAMAAEFRGPGIGLLQIRPWGASHLLMRIVGLDVQGLETAARLFPKRTGLLVPDWIITGPEMAWKGAGGILAAGYWGNHWEYQTQMSA